MDCPSLVHTATQLTHEIESSFSNGSIQIESPQLFMTLTAKSEELEDTNRFVIPTMELDCLIKGSLFHENALLDFDMTYSKSYRCRRSAETNGECCSLIEKN